MLVAVATAAALLGGLAFVTGEGVLAALAGLCSLAAASLASRVVPATSELARRRRGAPAHRETAPATVPVQPFVAHGILGEPFLRATLENRVAAARRALRPLSVVLLEVAPLEEHGAEWVTEDLVATSLSSTLRAADIAGRRTDGVYVFVLEDTGEDGAVWTAERMRRNLASATGRCRFRAGIASYPSHGLDADAVTAKAVAALDAARAWTRDRIEVATGG